MVWHVAGVEERPSGTALGTRAPQLSLKEAGVGRGRDFVSQSGECEFEARAELLLMEETLGSASRDALLTHPLQGLRLFSSVLT